MVLVKLAGFAVIANSEITSYDGEQILTALGGVLVFPMR
jgi:hypothetical protein